MSEQYKDSEKGFRESGIPEGKILDLLTPGPLDPSFFTGKRIAFVRGGFGLGDMIQCTPVLSRLKKAGAKSITAWCWPQTEPILRHNPNIDAVRYFDPRVSNPDLPAAERKQIEDAFRAEIETDFDHLLYLGFSVEGNLVFKSTLDGPFDNCGLIEGRRKKADGINLYEEMLRRSGLPPEPGDRCLPEFYFSVDEEGEFAEFAKQKKKNQKWILWNPAGSTQNKLLPYSGMFIRAVLKKYPNSRHFLVGSLNTDIADPRVEVIGLQWPVRRILSFLRAMDLVVAPDSFILNAAGAWKGQKMTWLTHTGPEHIIKNFYNCQYVQARTKCSPCYLIPVNYAAVWDSIPARRMARAIYKNCVQYSPEDPYRPLGFRCVFSLDIDDFMKKIFHGLKQA